MPEPYRLVAAEVSLFASRKVLTDIVRPKTGLTMIPVLLTPEGEAVQDTTAIIDHIEARQPERSAYPSTPLLRLASLLLELYAGSRRVSPIGSNA